MGRAWMIAAVRRVRDPGTKFDAILTLRGELGKVDVLPSARNPALRGASVDREDKTKAIPILAIWWALLSVRQRQAGRGGGSWVKPKAGRYGVTVENTY